LFPGFLFKISDYQRIMCKKLKLRILPLLCPSVLFFFLDEKEPKNQTISLSEPEFLELGEFKNLLFVAFITFFKS